jgi:hypothetical protein
MKSNPEECPTVAAVRVRNIPHYLSSLVGIYIAASPSAVTDTESKHHSSNIASKELIRRISVVIQSSHSSSRRTINTIDTRTGNSIVVLRHDEI